MNWYIAPSCLDQNQTIRRIKERENGFGNNNTTTEQRRVEIDISRRRVGQLQLLAAWDKLPVILGRRCPTNTGWWQLG
jgi:hypothetical protein